MMEELPYFLKLLKSNQLINTAVTTGAVSEADLNGLVYSLPQNNIINLKNFKLSDQEKFKSVNIFMSSFGVLIDFISKDEKYFINAPDYFNTHTVARYKTPYIKGRKIFKVKGIKLAEFKLFERTVQGSVMQSDLYGCKIMLSFF
ncbi:MAG: hypothetical protein V4592_15230 [Bacteroidota bacterium]